MQISSVNKGLPFKAQVESTNPLISGNWAYLQEPPAPGADSFQSNSTVKENKSHWLRNTIITLVALGLAGWGLVKGKNSKSVQEVMKMKNSANKTLKQKGLKLVGTLGDYVERGYNATIGKLVNWAKKYIPGLKGKSKPEVKPKPKAKPSGKSKSKVTTGTKKQSGTKTSSNSKKTSGAKTPADSKKTSGAKTSSATKKPSIVPKPKTSKK